MRINKISIILLAMVMLLASCKKDHYDLDNVDGVHAEGEMLLPLAHKSFTLMEMMERFQIDSLIQCDDDGTLSYSYFYEHLGAVKGEELLRFNDLAYHEYYEIENPIVGTPGMMLDTVIHFEQKVVFEADHIGVLEAVMRSGHFDFNLESNVGILHRVVLRSPDITDDSGHAMEFDFDINGTSFGFDLEGYRFETDSVNTLHFDYDIYLNAVWTSDPTLFFEIDIQGTELAFSEMRGYVERFESRSQIDTVFSLFPDNLSGVLEINNARMRLSERNTFEMSARLEVDTALVSGEGFAPFSLFDPMPLSVSIPPQRDFAEVLDKTLQGIIAARGGRALASSVFVVNTNNDNDLVTVDETCDIDVRVDVEIPFAFAVDEVQYLDTVNMKLDQIEFPDLIEMLTLELTFNSTLPLNLNARFFMYDSEHEVVTDTLAAQAQLISASFDGTPTTTNISLDITEDRINKVVHSDRIIMVYGLDTDAHDVKLNANQKLELSSKARIKYDGIVDLDK
ncbi:MAG: hypothetical protein IJ622_00555 [Bacteroidales bacterium]|nr:hypothetical protein [Bacteroidales bacterium]